MTTRLERFAPRTRAACCATCDGWRVAKHLTARGLRDAPWCDVPRRFLPRDLTACGCEAWQPETTETEALLLFVELSEGGAK